MGIVRPDKRKAAIEHVAELNAQLRGLLATADALQATIESLEVELGLANEGEQASRDQFMVMHYRRNEDTGHLLSECSEKCAEDDSMKAVGEGDDEPEKDKPSQDDIGDGSGTGD